MSTDASRSIYIAYFMLDLISFFNCSAQLVGSGTPRQPDDGSEVESLESDTPAAGHLR